MTVTDKMLSPLLCHLSCSIPRRVRARCAHGCYGTLKAGLSSRPWVKTLWNGGGEEVNVQSSQLWCQALWCWEGREASSLTLRLPTLQQSVALTALHVFHLFHAEGEW